MYRAVVKLHADAGGPQPLKHPSMLLCSDPLQADPASGLNWPHPQESSPLHRQIQQLQIAVQLAIALCHNLIELQLA